jgi:hypothetical protein
MHRWARTTGTPACRISPTWPTTRTSGGTPGWTGLSPRSANRPWPNCTGRGCTPRATCSTGSPGKAPRFPAKIDGIGARKAMEIESALMAWMAEHRPDPKQE